MQDDKVRFGYQWVTAAEKRRLVDGRFESIASTYDLADTLLSFGLHSVWKQSLIRRLNLRPGHYVLDLCGGTADLALLATQQIGEDGRVLVYDISGPMMAAGKRKCNRAGIGRRIDFVRGDAEAIGLASGSFDAVMVGFGIRNLIHMEQGLSEIRRVLKPAGKVAILEFSIPESALLRRLYHQYSFQVMPRAARWICGTSEPFIYLAESIRVFPSAEQFSEMMKEAGFGSIVHRPLTYGLAALYSGIKR